jgi:hypothetical protein
MKPNIRGFTRSHMSPGLFGWTARVSGQSHSLIVEYRLPLRKNWLIRMTKDPQVTIIQSRSGLIHIVRPQRERAQGNSIRTHRFKSRRAAVAGLVVVVAIFLVGAFSQIAPQQSDSKMNDSQHAVKVLESPDQCSDSEYVSISNIQNALIGVPSELKILERSKSIELGGYRLTSITVECQSQRFRLKITEAKVKSTWKLKKTARLEN